MITRTHPSMQGTEILTTSHGHPIDDKKATITIGPRGGVALEDFVFLDEMAHFDRERIPERVVHAKGAGKPVYLLKYFRSLCTVKGSKCIDHGSLMSGAFHSLCPCLA